MIQFLGGSFLVSVVQAVWNEQWISLPAWPSYPRYLHCFLWDHITHPFGYKILNETFSTLHHSQMLLIFRYSFKTIVVFVPVSSSCCWTWMFCVLWQMFDNPEELKAKVETLAQLIKESQYLVVHSGAGISTSTGIPDFRWGTDNVNTAPFFYHKLTLLFSLNHGGNTDLLKVQHGEQNLSLNWNLRLLLRKVQQSQNKICEHGQLSSCSFFVTLFQHISEPPLLDTAWEWS